MHSSQIFCRPQNSYVLVRFYLVSIDMWIFDVTVIDLCLNYKKWCIATVIGTACSSDFILPFLSLSLQFRPHSRSAGQIKLTASFHSASTDILFSAIKMRFKQCYNYTTELKSWNKSAVTSAQIQVVSIIHIIGTKCRIWGVSPKMVYSILKYVFISV